MLISKFDEYGYYIQSEIYLGTISHEGAIDIAGDMKLRSMAKELARTKKDIVGTCFMPS